MQFWLRQWRDIGIVTAYWSFYGLILGIALGTAFWAFEVGGRSDSVLLNWAVYGGLVSVGFLFATPLSEIAHMVIDYWQTRKLFPGSLRVFRRSTESLRERFRETYRTRFVSRTPTQIVRLILKTDRQRD